MSVINQVLQDLEKRGVNREQTRIVAGEVRTVTRSRSPVPHWRIAMPLIVAAAFVGGWVLLQYAHVVPTPTSAISVAPPGAAAAPAPLEPSSPVPAAPAQRLSFELSAVPAYEGPPENPAAKPVSATPRQPEAKPVQSGKAVVAEIHRSGPAREARPGPESGPPRAPAMLAKTGSQPAAESPVDKQIKQVSPQQRSDNEFKKAVSLMQQGRIAEALEGFGTVLQIDPGHDGARQAMVGLLLEAKRVADAERVLQDGLKLNSKHAGFAMALARIQVEKGDTQVALDTLQKALPYATNQADYHAFVGALLQRQGHHKEATEQYQAAVRLSPQVGVWLMGLGISLQAEDHLAEAQDAFRRAKASNSLNAELLAFVDQRLRQIQQQMKQ